MPTTKRIRPTASGVFVPGSAEGVIVANLNEASTRAEPISSEPIVGTQFAFAAKVLKRAIGIKATESQEAHR